MKFLYEFIKINLRKNKKRTLVSVIGVALSCSLLFSVGLFTSTYRDNAIREAIRYNGSHHIEYRNIDKSKIDIIKKDHEVEKVILKDTIDYGMIEHDEEQSYVDVLAINVDYNSIFSNIKGRVPKSSQEVIISRDLATLNDISVNDTIIVNNSDKELKYTVVGVYLLGSINNIYNPRNFGYESVYTYFSLKEDSKITAFVTLSSPKHGIGKLNNLTLKLELPFPDLELTNSNEYVEVNTGLLFLYGEMFNAGTYAVMFLSIMLISTVLSIVCILIIYNAFAISVTERKRQIGILASVGATPMQVLKMVLIEAGIISLIAIPISFILSIINVSFTLLILNKILDITIAEPLRLSIYPYFMLMSLTFVFFTIFLAALFPAVRASEITPIEAIRQNKDIKIKGKKLKRNKLIFKMFGIEGDIALKNIKRNKKKYRITTISLVISIVLFLVMSTYLNAAFEGADVVWDGMPKHDISITIYEGDGQQEFIDKVKEISEVKEVVEFKRQNLSVEKVKDEFFDEKYLKAIPYDSYFSHKNVSVILLENKTYQKYLKKLKLKSYQPIIINYGKFQIFDNNEGVTVIDYNPKTYEGPIFNEDPNTYFNFCNYEDIEYKNTSNCYYKIDNVYFTDFTPYDSPFFNLTIVVNEKTYNDLVNKQEEDMYISSANSIELQLMVNNAKIFEEEFNKISVESEDIVSFYYSNNKLQNHENKMVMLAYKFALYSFTAFITLIAVTSVTNTINTSMNLRKIEFAMFKSVGQSPKSFKKIIRLESIFLGVKSLFYGLLISYGIIQTIINIASLSYGSNKVKIPFPTIHVIVCVITVFIIIFLSMKYSTSKLKSDNIIDTIKKENI